MRRARFAMPMPTVFRPIPRLILLLPCSRNILFLRSETGRTTEWAQAHFFVAAGWLGRQTGLGRGVSRVNLEKIRAAAERVARSEGLEVVDVEWKVGKQRFLRVYIDRVPSPAVSGASSGQAGTAEQAIEA